MSDIVERLPRVETGAVRIGDDWAGVFIRGDQALAASLDLRSAADEYDRLGGSVLVAGALTRLADLLACCLEPCPQAAPLCTAAEIERLRAALGEIAAAFPVDQFGCCDWCREIEHTTGCAADIARRALGETTDE